MIRLYTGEYLISPFVLHFGMNWCSHGCAYCFANLNRPARRAEAGDLLRIAGWFERGSSCIEYQAMRAGHPVMTANDSDPCAKSNAPTFAALREASHKHKFRLVYQTRGGDPEAEHAIVNGEPTMVYVSLTTDRPDIAAQYESGAPSHAQRMDFIRRLRARGHMVIVGLNPLIPPWWQDIDHTLRRLADMGIRHAWHQPLHLSRFQVDAMTERFRLSHPDFIEYGMKRVEPHAEHYRAALDSAAEHGINTFRLGLSENGGFWDDYFSLGFPFVPTLDALVRDCTAQAGGQPAMIGLSAFNRWAKFMDQDRSICKEYLVKFGRSIRNLGEKQEARNMEQVHRFMWRTEDFSTPFRVNAFARVAYEDGWASDEDGVPLLAVSADGFHGPEVNASDCVYLESVERR